MSKDERRRPGGREEGAAQERDAVVAAARAVCATAQASWHQPGMIGVEAKVMNQLRAAVDALREAEQASD